MKEHAKPVTKISFDQIIMMNELDMFIYKTEMDSQPLSGMFLINISLAYHFQKYCRPLSNLTKKSPDST